MPSKILIIFLTLFLSNIAVADTIILISGRRIKVEKVWGDSGLIKVSVYGAIVG
jgi:hypothetical protein